jgi:hypothetical protein
MISESVTIRSFERSTRNKQSQLLISHLHWLSFSCDLVQLSPNLQEQQAGHTIQDRTNQFIQHGAKG